MREKEISFSRQKILDWNFFDSENNLCFRNIVLDDCSSIGEFVFSETATWTWLDNDFDAFTDKDFYF